MRPAYEVADVIRQFLPLMNQDKLLSHHRNTLLLLRDCRTAAMGGHINACEDCGSVRISYNSCRNRHCPKCQGINREMWIVQQEDMLLPVAYFHVVFTLPHELNELCLQQSKFMYDLLFRSAWHTLNTLDLDPKWLRAKTAATMVLHTWSQNLLLHPHVHCIVPNGGLTKDGQWQFPKRAAGKDNFLFPIPAMQKIFKGYFLQQLKKVMEQGILPLPATFPRGWEYKKWKNALYQKDWVVYTKKPFSGIKISLPRTLGVVNYLARYSHRVALTNHRIKNITEEDVIFQYKDYKDGAKKKLMSIKGNEFLRRFCLHMLPKGFRKVRQFGFLSNASKAKELRKARIALGCKHRELLNRKQRKQQALLRVFGQDQHQCPCCKKGRMLRVIEWERNKAPPDFLNSSDLK